MNFTHGSSWTWRWRTSAKLLNNATILLCSLQWHNKSKVGIIAYVKLHFFLDAACWLFASYPCLGQESWKPPLAGMWQDSNFQLGFGNWLFFCFCFASNMFSVCEHKFYALTQRKSNQDICLNSQFPKQAESCCIREWLVYGEWGFMGIYFHPQTRMGIYREEFKLREVGLPLW